MRQLRYTVLVFFLALVTSGLLVGSALTGFFILDDFAWLNCASQSASDPSHLFALHISNFFRPVAHLVWTVIHAIFGANPTAFHLCQLTLHAVATVLLGQLARRLFVDPTVALLCAVCFLLNPSYSEAIIWVSGLTEPVHAIAAISTLLAFHSFLTQPHKRAGFIGALVGFVLAHGAKESAVVILPLMGILHLGIRQQVMWQSNRSILWTYSPFVVLELGYLVAQLVLQQQSYLVRDGLFSIGPHGLVVLGLSLGHLVLLVWPPFVVAALALLDQRRKAETRSVWRPFVLLLAAVAVTTLPYAMFKGHLLASRYFYLPSMVMALAAGLALSTVLSSSRKILLILALAALFGLAFQTIRRTEPAVERYLQLARHTELFIKSAMSLPTDHQPVLILDGALQGQHLRGAMKLYHPRGARAEFRAVKARVLKSRPAGTVWRYDGTGGFVQIDLR